ncbi:phosphatidate cytidylyltransferase [Psychromarinibacter sp. C21-152]|uniref:Phosphatidate cytidylyltransferase n=1 Tax=Psychromarinibacter sediminicola TaxID=3033385 RepID=A0AAE3T9I9_9RHOB|nr:phosphatidate cytidylyltransferase [Psychromarinibacter sediminicola]MDF0602257.1 phosphatidate cytidylyltransferase [Psychromarinibacter sediminicola]
MTAGGRSWGDLRPRLITGLVLAAAGAAVIWAGGAVFGLTAALVVAVMVWELSAMIAPEKGPEAVQLAVLSAAAILLARVLPPVFTLPLLLAPGLVGISLLKRRRFLVPVAVSLVLLGTYGLVWFRDTFGMVWMFWLVGTVVATDIAGYFGGRAIGGPKFWPRVSPKKTWAGIVSGWVAAVLVTLAMRGPGEAGAFIALAVVISFASQMGDVAESAVKRRAGVKDASGLLPGHGGLFDRFDALLGAALFMMAASLVIAVLGLNVGQ